MFNNFTKRRLIIIGVAVVIVGVGIWFVILSANRASQGQPVKSFVQQGATVTPGGTGTSGSAVPPTPTPSLAPVSIQSASDAIQAATPYLSNANGQPTFGIVKFIQPLPGWYIATLAIQGNGQQSNKIILRQTGDANNPLTIVAGPGTSFPPEFVSLPDAVRNAL